MTAQQKIKAKCLHNFEATTEIFYKHPYDQRFSYSHELRVWLNHAKPLELALDKIVRVQQDDPYKNMKLQEWYLFQSHESGTIIINCICDGESYNAGNLEIIGIAESKTLAIALVKNHFYLLNVR
jgi:hypothetical protein